MASSTRRKRASFPASSPRETRSAKKHARLSTPAVSIGSRFAGSSVISDGEGDGEHDGDDEGADPLAMTPLRPRRAQMPSSSAQAPSSTQGGGRRMPSSTATARTGGSSAARRRPPPRARGLDAVLDAAAAGLTADRGQVVSVRGTEEDLVPPSDEEEFEEWVDQRAEEKRKAQLMMQERKELDGRSSMPSSTARVSSASTSARTTRASRRNVGYDSPLAAVRRKGPLAQLVRSPTPETLPLYSSPLKPRQGTQVLSTPPTDRSTDLPTEHLVPPQELEPLDELGASSSEARPKFFTFFSDDFGPASQEFALDDDDGDVTDVGSPGRAEEPAWTRKLLLRAEGDVEQEEVPELMDVDIIRPPGSLEKTGVEAVLRASSSPAGQDDRPEEQAAMMVDSTHDGDSRWKPPDPPELEGKTELPPGSLITAGEDNMGAAVETSLAAGGTRASVSMAVDAAASDSIPGNSGASLATAFTAKSRNLDVNLDNSIEMLQEGSPRTPRKPSTLATPLVPIIGTVLPELEEDQQSYHSPLPSHGPTPSSTRSVRTPSKRLLSQAVTPTSASQFQESQLPSYMVPGRSANRFALPSPVFLSPVTPSKPYQRSTSALGTASPTTPTASRRTPRALRPSQEESQLPRQPSERQRSESPDVLELGPSRALPAESALTPPPAETMAPMRARFEPSLADNRLETMARRPIIDEETLALVDPALYQFRSARTFRTRTALQLQPYTREKQLYEAVLRKGGLKKGKHAIAPGREISPGELDEGEDEAQLPESESAEIGAPDGSDIVIGGTSPPVEAEPERVRRQVSPKPVDKQDLDEFFVDHGREADEEDEADARALQKIVTARLRNEKEARKIARANERAQKEFQRLMRETARSGATAGDAPKSTAPARPAKKPRSDERSRKDRPGRVKTYAGKSKPPVPAFAGFEDDSDLSDAPDLEAPVPRRPVQRRSPSPPSPPIPATGVSRPPALHYFDNEDDDSYDAAPAPFDFANDHEDVEMMPSPFFVDDLPPAKDRNASRKSRPAPGSDTGDDEGDRSSAGDEDDDSDGSDSDRPQDRRAKIAARMLPAAMLRRLEREAAAKEARKAQLKRRDAAARNGGRVIESPVRPGHAVVRRGGLGQAVAFDDVVDYAASSSQDAGGAPCSPLPASARGMSDATPILISDGEGSDSSSQAEEDGRGVETLARLYDGDYESIVAGPPLRRLKPHGDIQNGSKRRGERQEKQRKLKRPAMRFVDRPAHVGHARSLLDAYSRDREPVQSRLQFPADGKRGSGHDRKRKRQDGERHRSISNRHAGHRSRPRVRPVIRVNEESIFAVQDFAFDSDDADPAPDPPTAPPASDRNARARGGITVVQPKHPISKTRQPQLSFPPAPTPSRAKDTTAAVPRHNPLDEGIGKARSWANFERFPIDFDISPLPSGLYCSTDSVVGNGSLRALLRSIRTSGETGTEDREQHLRVYDFELGQSMTCEALQAVVPFILEAMGQAALDVANETMSRGITFEWFGFIASYLAGSLQTPGHANLIDAIQSGVSALSAKVDDAVGALDVKRDKLVIDQLLLLGWHILGLTLCLARLPRSDIAETLPEDLDRAAVEKSVASLLKALLASGFDRAVKPLKQILRGEADSPEISETSTILWIAVVHSVTAYDPSGQILFRGIEQALEATFPHDKQGPLAAERVWFLAFGLSALSQFGADGRTTGEYEPVTRWDLVKKAISLIKISHNEEAEERARADQLLGRDRYIRVMLARCVRLSSAWRWAFDRDSFSVATRDLGVIFKDRQHRNFPTEPPVNYPLWITNYDISLTAEGDSKRETAFELYLRLVCVAASDLIASSQSLSEAQQAEKDVQRLIMSIIPVSPVRFNRLHPPSPRQLGQLINRYSTIIAACYFSPSLLSWLLANAKKWAPFESADFESRQISIRGLMYLAVACRHHQYGLEPVMARMAEILAVLQKELEATITVHGSAHQPMADSGVAAGVAGVRKPERIEVQRTMVLVVSCIRQVILHHSFDPEQQALPAYPDPCLLHHSWTERIFDLSTNDPRSGLEIVGTIQAFLDARAEALPRRAKQARDERLESQDEEFGSLGFELDPLTIARLGGDDEEGAGLIERQDEQFADIIEKDISPRIYRILSDLLPAEVDGPSVTLGKGGERDVFVAKLTKCWSDCAAVVVVEHHKLEWSTFVGPFGRQSWARLGSERGRQQVGLHFMLNVLRLDPGSFRTLSDELVSLLFEAIVIPRSTVEHEFVSSLLSVPGARSYPLFEGMDDLPVFRRGGESLDAGSFLEGREQILKVLFDNLAGLLADRQDQPTCRKSFLYSCVQLLVSSMVSEEKAIPEDKVILRQSYRAFTEGVVHTLVQRAGQYINKITVPDLKHFHPVVSAL